MQAQPPAAHSGRQSRDPASDSLYWHLPLIVCVSAWYESLFVHHGIAWLFDEGWTLYAAMRLHAGGVLYQDVFFVFPPGHLLPAWLAYAIDPPGIILARVFYSVFNVALCVAMYFLARRLMRPSFALLCVLLLAIAAPRSHLSHLLFGYRYLVLSVLVLLAFARRLDLPNDEASRSFWWMFAAGVAAGVSVYFRLDPAFAASCAVVVGVFVRGGKARVVLRDFTAYGLGISVVLVPILVWFAAGVGLETVWREAVVRPMWMTVRQSVESIPFSVLPESGSRADIFRWFIALQFRLYGVMYAGYLAFLVARFLRARRQRVSFDRVLLLATVVWGGVFTLRSLGRSDDHHLMSALPPACVLIAHALDRSASLVGARLHAPRLFRRICASVLIVFALGAWGYLQRVDLFLTSRYRGEVPLASTGDTIRITSRKTARRIDRVVELIRKTTRPGDVVLDLTGAPLLHVLSERFGPGYGDVVTPGIFMSEAEERAFLERLRADPPAVVLWPRRDFDGRSDRSLVATAPEVAAFVRENYRELRAVDRIALLVPARGSRLPSGRATEPPPAPPTAEASASPTVPPTKVPGESR